MIWAHDVECWNSASPDGHSRLRENKPASANNHPDASSTSGTHLETVDILRLRDDTSITDTELVVHTKCRQTVHPDRRYSINAEDLILTSRSVQAGLTKVLEEAVETSTEYDDVLRVLDHECPCGLLVREVGVLQ